MKTMRLCRYFDGESGRLRFGIVEGEAITPLHKNFTLQIIDSIEAIDSYVTERPFKIEGARLSAPVMPSKIVCVGRNYAEHV